VSDRILFVIGSLNYGGAERHLVQVLPQLAKRGYAVEVFALSEPGAQARLLEEQGIRVYAPALAPGPANAPYRMLRLIVASWSLSIHLVTTRPNTVHFFLPQAYLLGGLCSLLTGSPRKVMSRRSRNFYQRKHPSMARVERWLHGKMDALIGNSLPVVADLKTEGAPLERLGLIRNGIDLAPFSEVQDRAAVRVELGIGEDELVFIKVANLIPYKGHEDLLRALAIADLPERWRLIVVGRDDGILGALRACAESHGLADRVIWAGPRTDVPSLLKAADVGVLASHEEGFSNAVLEYMAARLPAVVTDVGGNAEAVSDGLTGFVVPAHDERSLAHALERLGEARDRQLMGVAARERVEQLFSLDACIDAYETLYQSVRDGRGLSKSLRPEIF